VCEGDRGHAKVSLRMPNGSRRGAIGSDIPEGDFGSLGDEVAKADRSTRIRLLSFEKRRLVSV
jgi:hypothetical protein